MIWNFSSRDGSFIMILSLRESFGVLFPNPSPSPPLPHSGLFNEVSDLVIAVGLVFLGIWEYDLMGILVMMSRTKSALSLKQMLSELSIMMILEEGFLFRYWK